MSISTNDLKNGMALDLPEGLVNVVEFQHVKPGKGGAFVRTKLKNVRTGAVIDRTFRADEKVVLATIDKREMQFLYREGPNYVFMDNEGYDQLHVPSDSIGDAVHAGATCADVDRACREIIADAGLGDTFVHATGHGVGLEIHEAPRVAATGRDTLLVGDVVTVEPGVYLPGIGGVRIEDTVVVTATGSEPLTLTSKDLVL